MPTKKSVKSVKKMPNKKTVARRESGDGNVKMVSFGRAIANFFKKYFQFSGVATRAEYWWIILFWFLAAFVMIGTAVMVQPFNLLLAGFIALMWVLFCVVMMVPMWGLMSRRLHDAGFSAKLLWISFVFFVYSMLVPDVMHSVLVIDWLSWMWCIVVFILFLFPSKTKNNPYRD